MGALDAFRALMAELYLPMLSETGSWGHSTDKQSHAFLKVPSPLSVAIVLMNWQAGRYVLRQCQKWLSWELA